MRNQTAAQSGSSRMVQPTPDLTSLNGTGEFPPSQEEVGPDKQTVIHTVQMEEVSSFPRTSRPIPRNFVWRLHGGRRSSSTSPTKSAEPEGGEKEMAVDLIVPALRDSFDPWGHHHEREEAEEDERCKGCSKILKARAAAAAAAAAVTAAPRPAAVPVPSTPPHGE